MKIASWNVNSLRVRLPHVLDWLQCEQPDVLCLQELKMANSDFPADAFAEIGYHSTANGQKTYNGVAIISRIEQRNIITDLPGLDDPQRRFLAADLQTDKSTSCRVINIYAPNGQSLDSEKFSYKRSWYAALQLALRETLEECENVVLLGDFNIAPTDLDVHDPVKWRGKIHCSELERLMLQKLMAEGLYDTYRQFNTDADHFSWWDYRSDGYSRNEGLRIDLVLSSSAMLSVASGCYIDEAPRKLERPSDHTPVIAEFAL